MDIVHLSAENLLYILTPTSSSVRVEMTLFTEMQRVKPFIYIILYIVKSLQRE